MRFPTPVGRIGARPASRPEAYRSEIRDYHRLLSGSAPYCCPTGRRRRAGPTPRPRHLLPFRASFLVPLRRGACGDAPPPAPGCPRPAHCRACGPRVACTGLPGPVHPVWPRTSGAPHRSGRETKRLGQRQAGPTRDKGRRAMLRPDVAQHDRDHRMQRVRDTEIRRQDDDTTGNPRKITAKIVQDRQRNEGGRSRRRWLGNQPT